jgi:hypothetical protein
MQEGESMAATMRPLEWFEHNARNQLAYAQEQQAKALEALKAAYRDELEARVLLNAVARAKEKGKKEMKVK